MIRILEMDDRMILTKGSNLALTYCHKLFFFSDGKQQRTCHSDCEFSGGDLCNNNIVGSGSAGHANSHAREACFSQHD